MAAVANFESSESRPPGRPRDRLATHAILVATLDVIAERGFAGFTMRAVADRAAVGLPTIYRRWRSKQDLAEAAIEAALGSVMSVPDTGNLRDDLTVLLNELIDYITEPKLGRVWLALISESLRDEQWARPLAAVASRRRALTRVVVKRAVERGEIEAPVDVDLLLDLCHGPIWIRLVHLHQRPRRRLVKLILDSVLGTDAAPRRTVKRTHH